MQIMGAIYTLEWLSFVLWLSVKRGVLLGFGFVKFSWFLSLLSSIPNDEVIYL